MTSRRNDKVTPAWLLERLAQGELGAAEADELRARLAAAGRSLDEELAALRESNRQILAERPKNLMAAAIRRRAEEAGAPHPNGRARWGLAVAPLALAGALGALFVVVRGGGSTLHPSVPGGGTNHQTGDEETRIKGDPVVAARLIVYRQRQGGDGPERLSEGARAARGDLLQLAYAAPESGSHGVLLSIDGAGRVTQHLPEEGARAAAPLRAGREVRLPSAYQLDDAPAFERFVLVTSPSAFDVEAVMEAARSLAAQGLRARAVPLRLAPSFRQSSFLIVKPTPGAP